MKRQEKNLSVAECSPKINQTKNTTIQLFWAWPWLKSRDRKYKGLHLALPSQTHTCFRAMRSVHYAILTLLWDWKKYIRRGTKFWVGDDLEMQLRLTLLLWEWHLVWSHTSCGYRVPYCATSVASEQQDAPGQCQDWTISLVTWSHVSASML